MIFLLKSDNILINKDSKDNFSEIKEICICDFGLSKNIMLSTANTLAGTFMWIR